MSEGEKVDHPAHYGGGKDPYEAIKVMEAWSKAWAAEGASPEEVTNLTQALKYLRRYMQKGTPTRDLAKADWYLSRAREHQEGLDPNQHLLSTHRKRVEKMQKAFGQAVRNSPKLPPLEERRSRARLILEEALETVHALGIDVNIDTEIPGEGIRFCFDDLYFSHGVYSPNLQEIADGCADLSVVLQGTLASCGIPDRPLLDLVDQNNLEKVESGHLDGNGKFVKPAGHKPPDIGKLLEMLSIR